MTDNDAIDTSHLSADQAVVLVALTKLELKDRVAILRFFCRRCGTREDEGLRPLLRGNQCPCDPSLS